MKVRIVRRGDREGGGGKEVVREGGEGREVEGSNERASMIISMLQHNK